MDSVDFSVRLIRLGNKGLESNETAGRIAVPSFGDKVDLTVVAPLLRDTATEKTRELMMKEGVLRNDLNCMGCGQKAQSWVSTELLFNYSPQRVPRDIAGMYHSIAMPVCKEPTPDLKCATVATGLLTSIAKSVLEVMGKDRDDMVQRDVNALCKKCDKRFSTKSEGAVSCETCGVIFNCSKEHREACREEHLKACVAPGEEISYRPREV
jgi:hypothetical protein